MTSMAGEAAGAAAAAVIAAKRRRMIRLFREAGATEPEFACRPEDLGVRRSWLFDRLAQRGVFVLVADGRFFLDEAGVERYRQSRKTRALLALIVFGLIFLFLMMGR